MSLEFELFQCADYYAEQHKQKLDILREQIKDAVNSVDPEDWLNLPRLCKAYLSSWELFADQAAKEKVYNETCKETEHNAE